MASQDRIIKMKAAMLRCLKSDELMQSCREWSKPVRMYVTYWDGPGIQFISADDKALLANLIRDEDQAITLWNALTDCAPIDAAWFE